VRHPNIDPERITQTLRLQPDHAWARGEARTSESGGVVGGNRHETYWSATLTQPFLDKLQHMDAPFPISATRTADPDKIVALALAGVDVSTVINTQLLQWRRERDFIRQLSAEGDVTLVIEIAADAGTTIKFDPALLRQLTDLGLRLEFGFE
jgi:hypothetical protein